MDHTTNTDAASLIVDCLTLSHNGEVSKAGYLWAHLTNGTAVQVKRSLFAGKTAEQINGYPLPSIPMATAAELLQGAACDCCSKVGDHEHLTDPRAISALIGDDYESGSTIVYCCNCGAITMSNQLELVPAAA